MISHVNGLAGMLKWPPVKFVNIQYIKGASGTGFFCNVNLGNFVPGSFLLLHFSCFQLEALLCTDDSDLKAFRFVS